MLVGNLLLAPRTHHTDLDDWLDELGPQTWRPWLLWRSAPFSWTACPAARGGKDYEDEAGAEQQQQQQQGVRPRTTAR